MAQSRSFLADVKRELECSVCQEQFSEINEPKILKCLHTFCKSCLEAWLRQQREGAALSCPTCRQITACPNNNINSLPSNLFYKQMVDIVKAWSGQGQEDSPNCGNCDERKLLKFYCSDCNCFLCEECAGAHKKLKVLSGHHVKEIGNFESSDAQDYARRTNVCKQHKDEVRFYCEQCVICICRDCAILEHRGHNIISIEQGIEKNKSEIEAKIREVQVNGGRLRNQKEFVEKRRLKVNKSIEEATEEAHRVAERCILLIRQHEASVTERLTKKKATIQDEFANQLNGLDGKLAEIDNSLAFSEEVIVRKNLPEILNVKAMIEQRLKELSTSFELMPILDYSEVKYIPNDVSFLKDAPGKLVTTQTEPSLSLAEFQESRDQEEAMDVDPPQSFRAVRSKDLIETYIGQVKVSVYKGDLTNEQVDVIVNAANDRLQHDGGVAKAILDRGGKVIRKESNKIIQRRGGQLKGGEAVYTKAGKLPCKMVVHAVKPEYLKVGLAQSKNLLRRACLNSLTIAQKSKMTSIALPAIGSGMPKDVCAEVMFDAVDEFFRQGDPKGKTITDVRFVNIDESSVQAFRKEFFSRSENNQEHSKTSKLTGGGSFKFPPTAEGSSSMTYSRPDRYKNRNVKFSDNSRTATNWPGDVVAGHHHSTTLGSSVADIDHPLTGSSYFSASAKSYSGAVKKTPGSNDARPSTVQEPRGAEGGKTGFRLSGNTRATTNPSKGVAGHHYSTTFGSSFADYNYDHPLSSFNHSSSSTTTYSVAVKKTSGGNDPPPRVQEPGGAEGGKTEFRLRPGGKENTTDRKDDDFAFGGAGSETECPICLDTVKNARTLKCKHVFCTDCVETALKHYKRCPVCKEVQGFIQGNQPEGGMRFHQSRESLPGYYDCDTIIIDYFFRWGTQGPEHPNPGQRYDGTRRTAYLPDNHEGREVLQLLRRAFDARLVFTVGTSVTTGRQNQVTWNDIHHKTNMSGGPQGFGYPDPGYLRRVKEDLAAKGIR